RAERAPRSARVRLREGRPGVMRVQPIHVAVLISLLLHAAILWQRAPHRPFEEGGLEPPDRNLRVHLDVFLAPSRPPTLAPSVSIAPVPRPEAPAPRKRAERPPS